MDPTTDAWASNAARSAQTARLLRAFARLGWRAPQQAAWLQTQGVAYVSALTPAQAEAALATLAALATERNSPHE